MIYQIIAASLVTAPAPTVSPGAEGTLESVETDPNEAISPASQDKAEFGPFFEGEPVSDTAHPTVPRPTKKTPILSVQDGAFCFINGSHCKASMILTASVAAGMRVPASDAGPDIPFAMFTFRGGVSVRPLMFGRRKWHAWGLGLVGSWSRGTGSLTLSGDREDPDVDSTSHTDAWRLAAVNQLWVSKKRHGMHIDFTLGAVQSAVLTEGVALWGTHAEVAVGWGGWGSIYAGGDFLDRDSRVFMGFRGHGIAAGPVIAMVLAGLAIGGAL